MTTRTRVQPTSRQNHTEKLWGRILISIPTIYFTPLEHKILFAIYQN